MSGKNVRHPTTLVLKNSYPKQLYEIIRMVLRLLGLPFVKQDHEEGQKWKANYLQKGILLDKTTTPRRGEFGIIKN